VGELNSFHSEADPRPIWHWAAGLNTYTGYSGYRFFQYEIVPVIGWCWGQLPPAAEYYDRVRSLGYDDTTTIQYYAMFAHGLASTDSNVIIGYFQTLSKFSDKLYVVPIIMEARTAGYMELRGTLRNIFACNPNVPIGYPMGSSGEYINLPLKGMMIPWNGSRLLAGFTGKSRIG